jgi:hypothetical protein
MSDSGVDEGIDDLENRRARSTEGRVHRKAPDPKVRRKQRGQEAGEQPSDTSREITRETAPKGMGEGSDDSAPEVAAVVATESAAAVPPVVTAEGLPVLEVDLSAVGALKAAPTTLNVPASVVERFEAVRSVRTTHAALMLHAVRTEAERLPELVLARRPELREGDPFPLRPVPGEEQATERPGTLRVRPIRAEVEVLDRLAAWVDAEVQRRRPGGRKVSRSEVVTAALDAYLPPLKKSRKK